MKKLFLFFSFLFSISCKSQNNNMQNNNMIIPTIDSKFEKFDKNKFPEFNYINTLRKKVSDGYIQIMKNKTNISYEFTPNNSLFTVIKIYHLNSNIKLKGMGFNVTAFRKGIWYEFDENGKLIKEIDYDQPFKFTFEEIVKFCEKENIPLTKGPIINGFHTRIRRNAENKPPIWKIEWLKKPDVIETITLDGISGKVLSRTEAEYISH